MVNDAHGQLDAGSQSRKTTAIGVDSNGNYYIASNNDTVPRPQRAGKDHQEYTFCTK